MSRTQSAETFKNGVFHCWWQKREAKDIWVGGGDSRYKEGNYSPPGKKQMALLWIANGEEGRPLEAESKPQP